mgnify:CR=1 FL=1
MPTTQWQPRRRNTWLAPQTGALISTPAGESIELFRALGAKFTPELKSPVVAMPFEGDYSQQDYARQMIQDYIDAGVQPEDVWPQSFNLKDVLFWVDEMPEFGRQAVFLRNLYGLP